MLSCFTVQQFPTCARQRLGQPSIRLSSGWSSGRGIVPLNEEEEEEEEGEGGRGGGGGEKQKKKEEEKEEEELSLMCQSDI